MFIITLVFVFLYISTFMYMFTFKHLTVKKNKNMVFLRFEARPPRQPCDWHCGWSTQWGLGLGPSVSLVGCFVFLSPSSTWRVINWDFSDID